MLFNSGYVAAILLIVFRLFVDLVLFSVKKNGKLLVLLTEKIAKSPEDYPKVKKQLQEYSE
jgi:hypothetical protein